MRAKTPIENPNDIPRCAQEVWTYGGTEQCLRKGYLLEGGKLWCAQHAPSRQKDRQEREAARGKVRYEKIYKPRAHATAMLALIREIAQGKVYDPQARCASFIAQYDREGSQVSEFGTQR